MNRRDCILKETFSLFCITDTTYIILFIGVLDHLQVKTDEGTFTLIQLGQISQKNPSMVIVDLSTMPQVSHTFLAIGVYDGGRRVYDGGGVQAGGRDGV